ncbi:MAG: T9SS type A sorting domain-containing protein [Saprospiraceae bacterium]|nr:T9SS type A sorting domain-containing protein [Saprospiraceae bacterium]
MNSIMRILFILFAFAILPRVHGQLNPPLVELNLTNGMVYYDTITSNLPPAPFFSPEGIGYVSNQSIGSGKYAIEISLQNSYTGLLTIQLQYFTGNFPPQPRWSVYKVNCVSSIVKAHNDYLTHDGINDVVIHPLSNDETTSDTLILNGIGQVQNGSAVVQGDSIIFTPGNEENAFIVYSVVDGEGNTSQGKISLNFEDEEVVFHDTLYFTLLNTKKQEIIFPFAGFNVLSPPTKGQLERTGLVAYEYRPDKNSIGTDVMEFEHDNGSSRRVEIILKTIPQYTSSVRDDEIYTAVNETITFNVFDNDLSSNFPINQYSPQLVYQGNGQFSYTPPNNFSGVKSFTYRVNYGTYTSTGKIKVFVDNCYPKQDIEYRFKSPKNVPLVVQYDVPIGNYTFSNAILPEFGSLVFYEPNDTITIGCNILTSKAMFVYSPDQNYYGEDEFQVSYCIDGQQCIIYKVYITVADETRDTLCHCIGKNCVWPGDFDNDGIVTVKDLLPLGRYLGHNGPERENIDYTYWHGQSSEDWGVDQKSGNDIKHVDANGDGHLTVSDQEAIENHFSGVHNVIPEPVLSIKDYPFYLIPNQTELDSGDLLILDIAIGNNQFPVLDLHGLAFGLQINPGIIDSSSFSGHFYQNGWFAYNTPSLQTIKHPSTGNVQAAFTRSGGSGVSGKGPIGQISFIIIDEIDGWKGSGISKNTSSRIYAGDIIMEDENGDRFQIPESYVDITVKKDRGPAQPMEDKLIIFPNPTSDWVYVHFNGRNTIYGYTLADALGRVVETQPSHNQQSLTLQTTNLSEGTYVLRVTTSAGVITKKIQIVRSH